VNSEHCRHKIFNAQWSIDGVTKSRFLFGLVPETHAKNPQVTISAYSDNAAVFEGANGSFLAPQRVGDEPNEWKQSKELVHSLIKDESHNHPTAISPYPGSRRRVGRKGLQA
ncbi:MAG: hypothetical protein Q9199_006314, partial [Rusavskia elegans]